MIVCKSLLCSHHPFKMNGSSDEDDTIMNSSDSDFEGAVKSVLQSERSWQ